MAVKSGSLPTVLLHIRRGVNVNSVADRGRTALMIAAAAGRLDICQLLLEEGASASAVDDEGNTALVIASRSGAESVVDLIDRYLERRLAAAAAPPPARAPAETHLPAPSVEERHSPITSAPLELESLLSEGGWDAEAEPTLPPDQDRGILAEVSAVQNAISARIASNLDADWSDLSIDLPSGDLASATGSEVAQNPAVKRILLQASVSGVIGAEQLAEVRASLTGSRQDGPSFIESLLEDLGCDVVDNAFDAWPAASPRRGEATSLQRSQARDAEAHLTDLMAHDPDLLKVHEGRTTGTKQPSKADQAGLWKSYRQGRRDLAFALATAPHILDELVARLDRLSAPSDPAAASADLEEIAENEAEDLSQVDEVQSRRAEHSLDALDPGLAQELGLAVLRARAQENPEVGLADQLLALELPIHLIEQVRRALLLDPASTVACADLATAANKINRARTSLVHAHQRFVLWIARRYQNRGLELMDLVQEGNIGLLKSIEKYDAARGFAFTTYATWWVRQSITRAIADKGATIRIPVHRQEMNTKVARAENAYRAQHGRDATGEELAAALDVHPDAVAAAHASRFEFVSITDTPGGATGNHVADVIADEPAKRPDMIVAAGEMRRDVALMLQRLTPRQERILRLRFGLNMPSDQTLEEIGDPMEVTRERIRQIEAKALKTLRHPSRGRLLGAHLGSNHK